MSMSGTTKAAVQEVEKTRQSYHAVFTGSVLTGFVVVGASSVSRGYHGRV